MYKRVLDNILVARKQDRLRLIRAAAHKFDRTPAVVSEDLKRLEDRRRQAWDAWLERNWDIASRHLDAIEH